MAGPRILDSFTFVVTQKEHPKGTEFSLVAIDMSGQPSVIDGLSSPESVASRIGQKLGATDNSIVSPPPETPPQPSVAQEAFNLAKLADEVVAKIAVDRDATIKEAIWRSLKAVAEVFGEAIVTSNPEDAEVQMGDVVRRMNTKAKKFGAPQ